MTNLTVIDFLKQLPKDDVIYYRSNPGNAGDALIAMGTFHLFESMGIQLEFIDPDNFDATNKTVIYAGGGNFNHIYPEARQFMAKHHKQAKTLILLPHTITENEDLLSEFGENVTLFARELVSYEHIKKHATRAQTYLDHDMALHIQIDKLRQMQFPGLLVSIAKKMGQKLASTEPQKTLPAIHKMWQVFQFEQKSVKQPKKQGQFFRQDVESSGRAIPSDNADLSVIYELGTRNQQNIEYTVFLLTRFIDQFESVATDRLHICVAAALLGKPVEFYGNSYFKCRAVYEYSLKERFSNIHWQS